MAETFRDANIENFRDAPYARAKNFVRPLVFSSVIRDSDNRLFCSITTHVFRLPTASNSSHYQEN